MVTPRHRCGFQKSTTNLNLLNLLCVKLLNVARLIPKIKIRRLCRFLTRARKKCEMSVSRILPFFHVPELKWLLWKMPWRKWVFRMPATKTRTCSMEKNAPIGFHFWKLLMPLIFLVGIASSWMRLWLRTFSGCPLNVLKTSRLSIRLVALWSYSLAGVSSLRNAVGRNCKKVFIKKRKLTSIWVPLPHCSNWQKSSKLERTFLTTCITIAFPLKRL